MGVEEQQPSPIDDEYKAVTSTLKSFYNFYSWQYGQVVKPKSLRLHSLTSEELSYFPWYPDLIEKLAERTKANQQFTEELAAIAAQEWGVNAPVTEWHDPKSQDFDKVRATLLQFAREWSTEGVLERKETIDRVVQAACRLYPDEQQRATVKVLVPGCGLGRQVFEFVRNGFWTQGNEVSYHMLISLRFVLNNLTKAESRNIFPYLHKLTHLALRELQLRSVRIPDVCPYSEFFEGDTDRSHLSDLMSMVAGSFVDLYGPQELAASDDFTDDPMAVAFREENRNSFDIVATSFFLDTAHNIIDYLKTIRNVLKVGGVWINVGPFHWHFEGDQTTRIVKRADIEGQIATSVPVIMEGLELTRLELLDLMKSMGFEILEHEMGIQTVYGGDSAALSHFVYGCDFWVARLLASK